MSFPRCVLNGVIADSTRTRFIRILPGGTPEKILTLTSAHTLDTILTFPDTAGVSDTLVLKDIIQTITNKNITSATNIVHANALKTSGIAVSVPSVPPTTGQVLQATSSTTSAWQTMIIATGDVVGPSAATDNAIARFDLATGKLVKNSIVIIGNAGDISGTRSLSLTTQATNPGSTNTLWISTADSSLYLGASKVSTGDVVGPSAATDNAIARFDLATGKLVKNSIVTIGNTGDISGTRSLSLTTQITNPGSANTIWINTADSSLYLGTSKVSTGDVVGPSAATDNAIARFDLATGKLVKNSIVTIDDFGAITIAGATATIILGTFRLLSYNTTANNLMVGYDAGNLTMSANNNLIVGSFAGRLTTTGGSNTILGNSAGNTLTTGVNNTYVGASAGSNNNTTSNNVAVGTNSLTSLSTQCVAVGPQVLLATGATRCIGIGYRALDGAVNPSTDCVLIGVDTCRAVNTITNSIAIGSLALNLHAGVITESVVVSPYSLTVSSISAVSKNTMLGFRQLFASTAVITENTTVGCRILSGSTTGAVTNNAILGSESLQLITAHGGINRNTLIGSRVLYSVISSGANTINDNIIIGYNAGSALTTAVTCTNNIWIGAAGVSAEINTTRIGAAQTACYIAGVLGVTPTSPQMVTIGTGGQLGSQAITAGDVFGPASATADAIARFNTTTGKLIKSSIVTISDAGIINSTAAVIITSASIQALRVGITTNVFLGVLAGNVTTGNNNTFVGDSAGVNQTTGNSNVFVGYFAGTASTTGGDQVFIGTGAGSTSGNNAFGSIGVGAGALAVASTFSIAMGWSAMKNGCTDSIAIGNSAGKGSGVKKPNSSILIGQNVASTTADATSSVIIGTNAVNLHNGGFVSSIIVGNSILSAASTSAVVNNTLVGTAVLTIASGIITQNAIVGANTFIRMTTGGVVSNAILGTDCLQLVQAHGGVNRNTFLGGRVLYNKTTISTTLVEDNIMIGYNAGSSNTSTASCSGNIWIGSPGAAVESSVTRIGAAQTACYIAGVLGVTPTSPQMVTIGTGGQLGSQAITAGDVFGPSSATDTAIARFDTTTGKLLKSSIVTISDAGIINSTAVIIITSSSIRALRVGDTNNVFFGLLAGNVTTGSGNTFIGDSAGVNQTTGTSNVFIGRLAGAASVLGGTQVFVGHGAGGSSGNSGNNCVGIGASALAVVSNFSVAVGGSALRNGGTNSVAIGYLAGQGTGAKTPNNSVLVGHQVASNTADAADSVIIGNNAVNSHTGSFTNSVILGTSILAGISATAVSKNTLIGAFQLNFSNGTITENSIVGARTLTTSSNGAIVGNAMLGTECLLAATSHGGVNRNTFLGGRVLYNKTTVAATLVEDNIMIGYNTGSANTSNANCSNNIWIGTPGVGSEVGAIRIGSAQTACYISGIRGVTPTSPQMVTVGSDGQLGSQALTVGDVAGPSSATDNAIVRFDLTTGKLVKSSIVTITDAGIISSTAVIIMRLVAAQVLRVGDNNNVFFGLLAGNANSVGVSQTFIGDNAGANQTGSRDNVFVGFNAGAASTTGTRQVFVGSGAGGGSGNSSDSCIGIGYNALTVTSNSSIAMGGYALQSGGANSIAIGYSAGLGNGTGTPNNSILVGHLVANRITTAVDSIIIGNNAINLHTGSFSTSVIMGANILSASSTTAVTKNTLVGAFQLTIASGIITENAIVGARTLFAATTGGTVGNAMLGTECLLAATAHGGVNRNTFLGGRVLYNKTTTGTTLIEDNIMIGYNAGSSNTSTATCSGNIWIGSPGAATESTTIRIGSAQTACYIAGVRGITTGAADAIAVLIDSQGQLGTVSSSIVYKTDVEDIENSDVIYSLRPVSFRYKKQQDIAKKSIGLIAEEVEKVYPDMAIYQDDKLLTVDYARLSILLLAEVQKLRAELDVVKALLK